MGKFANVMLIAAAAGLVVVGVAAQFGQNANAHGAVAGAVSQPVKPPTQPNPPTYIDTAPAPAEQTQPAPVVANSNPPPAPSSDSKKQKHSDEGDHHDGGDREGDD